VAFGIISCGSVGGGPSHKDFISNALGLQIDLIKIT
jgi:hypothetical protein